MMNMKNNKETRERMVWLLRMKIAENVNEGVKHWLRDKIDLTMWDMTVTDTDDLIGVAHHIEMDRTSAAFEKANDLDTAVRDVIPTEVWNWMSKVHADHKEHWAVLDDDAKYNA
jgi:hypothetical protein